jgi:hypothetical protein
VIPFAPASDCNSTVALAQSLGELRGLDARPGRASQRLRNLSPKRSQRYRFIEQYGAVLAGLSSRPNVAEGRDENDRDVELGVPQEFQDRETAQCRHSNIRDDKVDFVATAGNSADVIDKLISSARSHNVVALVLERRGKKLAQ